jgi:hypothetical protein
MKKPSDEVVLAELRELLSHHKAFENMAVQTITDFAQRGLKQTQVIQHGHTIIQQGTKGLVFCGAARRICRL